MCFDERQATIHVDASATTKIQGQADPAPSWTLRTDDFVLGDTAETSGIAGSPACSIAAHAEDPGTYPETIRGAPGLLSSSNYTFVAGRSADLAITARSSSGSAGPGGEGGTSGGEGGSVTGTPGVSTGGGRAGTPPIKGITPRRGHRGGTGADLHARSIPPSAGRGGLDVASLRLQVDRVDDGAGEVAQ